jgi:hypothetical protein
VAYTALSEESPPLIYLLLSKKIIMIKAIVFILSIIFILIGIIGCRANQELIEVLSVNLIETMPGPGGIINPGGAHKVEISLKNIGQEPILYLRATLELFIRSTNISNEITEEQSAFDALFDIEPSNPLLPGESRSGTCDIPGYIGIQSNILYPLILHATLQNETLDYTKQVQISEPLTNK